MLRATLFTLSFFIFTPVVLAQAPPSVQDQFLGQIDQTGEEVYSTADVNIFTVVGTIINVVFSLLGIILLFLIIYGGFLWMTAGGNDTQLAKAKRILVNAIIGLIIILGAYALAIFVTNAISESGLAGSFEQQEQHFQKIVLK